MRSIASHIEDYLYKGIYPMHMPGHKRNNDFFPVEPFRFDLTEIESMDNLHAPSGVIDEAQKRIAVFYGADWSRFLINGATGGITAAILAICGENDAVIVDRNSHRSVYGGLALSGARPVYVWPEITDFGLPGGICPARIEKVLSEIKVAKAVVITSPTYEGFVSDIHEIAKVTHAHGAVLIVDEAHGAHFPFHPVFPASALSMGADIAVNSLHKTLPLPSQCAVLHGKGNRVDPDRLQLFLSITQSSSPSYLFMTLMDQTMARLREDSQYFKRYADMLLSFRADFYGPRPLELVGEDIIGKWHVKAMDVGKLAFVINGALDGPLLEKRLAKEYGVQIELCGPGHILAMTSVVDEPEGFVRLGKGIREIGETLDYRTYRYAGFETSVPDMVFTPRQAVHKKFCFVDLSDAAGRVSADFIIPYPPGVPLVAAGECITGGVIARAIDMKSRGIAVIGTEENRCRVIVESEGEQHASE